MIEMIIYRHPQRAPVTWREWGLHSLDNVGPNCVNYSQAVSELWGKYLQGQGEVWYDEIWPTVKPLI